MISLVTDSTVCVKEEDARALDVTIVPMNYSINDIIYYESYNDRNGDFEALLQQRDQPRLSTAHPNPSAFLKAFEEAIFLEREIICITISSRLSGAYSSAILAAKQIKSDQIYVFDSRLTAGGLFLLVKQARKWIDAGINAHEIISRLEERRKQIRTAFTVDDINPLRKSGRMDFVRMSVITVLNIKPILFLDDGVVVSGGSARGSAEIITNLSRVVIPDSDRDLMTNATAKSLIEKKEFVINYLGDPRLATNIYNVLRERYPDVPICIQKIGPVLGIHLGARMASVSFAS